MANAKFKVGQVVRLKSGSPDMTVSIIDSDTYVWCQWFGGRKLERGRFDVDTLILSDEADEKVKK
ncbi:DUF2158 domain-containing protein [Rhodoblastus acidophilus]|uniref:DUF2158 domain-containing protein n=1 Tax=Rhodoblastus acidophilus TaxID=1074 RepID=A0A6N8DIG5_RHOAC|nr:uncharacterized protein YodC (DUF2158 family) [Rhodoblastus acidophilus]MTV30107.1 DUF2158 domain-containing protein [Rhodoblastus acidophilus]